MSSPYYAEGLQYDRRSGEWDREDEEPEFWNEVDEAYDRWMDEQLGF